MNTEQNPELPELPEEKPKYASRAFTPCPITGHVFHSYSRTSGGLKEQSVRKQRNNNNY